MKSSFCCCLNLIYECTNGFILLSVEHLECDNTNLDKITIFCGLNCISKYTNGFILLHKSECQTFFGETKSNR